MMTKATKVDSQPSFPFYKYWQSLNYIYSLPRIYIIGSIGLKLYNAQYSVVCFIDPLVVVRQDLNQSDCTGGRSKQLDEEGPTSDSLVKPLLVAWGNCQIGSKGTGFL